MKQAVKEVYRAQETEWLREERLYQTALYSPRELQHDLNMAKDNVKGKEGIEGVVTRQGIVYTTILLC